MGLSEDARVMNAKWTLVARALLRNQHQCGACGSDFDVDEEVFLIQIVEPYRVQTEGRWSVNFMPLLGADGDFALYPYFFHSMCWEEACDHLSEFAENESPLDLGSDGLVTCHHCKAHIAEGDTMGVVTGGNFVLSERQPNDKLPAIGFRHTTGTMPICADCLTELNSAVLENLWQNGPEGSPVSFTATG